MIHIGTGPPPSYEDPVAFLEHCHRRIEERLAALGRIVAALRAGGDPAEALAGLRDVVAYFAGPFARHHEDEDFSLFPRLTDDDTRATLDDLSGEHRTLEAIYLALRAVAERMLADPARVASLLPELSAHAHAYAGAIADHLAREEAEIFPRARTLDAAQLRAIGLEMRLRRGGDRG